MTEPDKLPTKAPAPKDVPVSRLGALTIPAIILGALVGYSKLERLGKGTHAENLRRVITFAVELAIVLLAMQLFFWWRRRINRAAEHNNPLDQ